MKIITDALGRCRSHPYPVLTSSSPTTGTAPPSRSRRWGRNSSPAQPPRWMVQTTQSGLNRYIAESRIASCRSAFSRRSQHSASSFSQKQQARARVRILQSSGLGGSDADGGVSQHAAFAVVTSSVRFLFYLRRIIRILIVLVVFIIIAHLAPINIVVVQALHLLEVLL